MERVFHTNLVLGGNMKNIKQSYRAGILLGILLIIVSCIAMKQSLLFAFYIAISYSITLLYKAGYEIRTLIKMIYKGIKSCWIIFVIIILMGMNISVWMSSGVVPTLIFYGLKYINNINFLVSCFLITGIISVVMGTALGTMSTIGIALIAIGKGMQIPEHIMLGAVLSGAFIADRISPVSGLVNLTLKSTGVEYKVYIKELVKTLVPSVFIVTIIYYFVGKGYTNSTDFQVIDNYMNSINDYFNITPYLLIFPVLILLNATFGIKISTNMILSIVAGTIISIYYQGISLSDMMIYLLYGYEVGTGAVQLDGIINGGGIIQMLEVLFIVAGAVGISSLLDATGIIDKFIRRIISTSKTKFNLVLKTGILSSGLTIVTCDQTVGIVLLGNMLKKDFEKKAMSNNQLARVISDTGTTIAPLIPWNVNSLLIVAITGITTIKYAPYTFLCYITPIVTCSLGLLSNKKS